MCGIWAIFGSDENLARQCACMWKISHRGPDAFCIQNVTQWSNSCALGFHRLAILDSIHGMQPMRLHALPHLWLICNGEIYNYKTVQQEFKFEYETACDAEAILHLYMHGGIKFASQQLDGVFAFCILDTAERKVFLGRDTYGVRPLFRTNTDDGFLAVCSEAKGLLELSKKKYTIEPFDPGHYEEYCLDSTGKATLVEKVRFHKMIDPPKYVTPALPSDPTNIHANIRNLLSTAVKKRMVAQRRVGCLLSGGLDSSLITALVVKHAKELNLPYKIQTFAIGVGESPDVIAAREVAKYLGTEHYEVVLNAEEGIKSLKDIVYHTESYDNTTAAFGAYFVSKYIREKTDTVVIFSGEGSDELTQGYSHFHEAPSAIDADLESRRLLSDLYMFELVRADRTAAAHGLELRVPFLDHQFSSYYLSLPPDIRQPKNGIEKYLLRAAFDGHDLIPGNILWRPKVTFSDGFATDENSWFQLFQAFMEEQVTDDMLDLAPEVFTFNPPPTKKDYYCRKVFESYYPGNAKWIPYHWKFRQKFHN